jgi:peroxiredoxin
MPSRPQPGAPLPEIRLPLLSGMDIVVGPGRGAWHLAVVYRGRHCPRCKPYLAKLERLLPDFAILGVQVLAISADPREHAAADVEEHHWTFPVAYGLDRVQMRALGLYISDPSNPQETSWPFAEPAIFVVNPDGLLHIVGVSNAASCRPDLDLLIDGIKGIQARGLPIRGLAA